MFQKLRKNEVKKRHILENLLRLTKFTAKGACSAGEVRGIGKENI